MGGIGRDSQGELQFFFAENLGTTTNNFAEFEEALSTSTNWKFEEALVGRKLKLFHLVQRTTGAVTNRGQSCGEPRSNRGRKLCERRHSRKIVEQKSWVYLHEGNTSKNRGQNREKRGDPYIHFGKSWKVLTTYKDSAAISSFQSFNQVPNAYDKDPRNIVNLRELGGAWATIFTDHDFTGIVFLIKTTILKETTTLPAPRRTKTEITDKNEWLNPKSKRENPISIPKDRDMGDKQVKGDSEIFQALMQIIDWFRRFPTILQGCESTIQMLLGQYTHSIGCFSEAALHFIEATKLTESKSMQAMCQIYAAISYICIGDAEASSQALDLIGPVYRDMDSYVGVREKTGVLFASGLLQMKQHNLQEARTRLASGLKVTHKSLGNFQLVSQYLTVLGSLALALHDIAQAREILKSSLTLAKSLHDIPTQIGVLAELTVLYRELGETANEAENSEYEARKVEDLKRRIESAKASPHHLHLLK
ncbi:hypothetical protein KI387_025568, partial [Taxus chinensis]